MNVQNIELFGGAGVGALVAVWALGTIASIRVVVPTNMVHIVQSGQKTTSYGKGRPAGNVYYRWGSHLPLLGVTVTELPESVFTVELNNYEAYDLGRLPFKVDVRAFFRIADSDTAAHRVNSHQDLINQLTAVLQGVVRRVLATNALESIMSDRKKLADEFTAEVEPQLSQWGIQTVKSIEFMDIRDHDGSNVIANIMAKEKSRIESDSRIAVAVNKQAAELREIEAKQVVDVRGAEAAQLVGQRKADAEKAVGISTQKAQQEVLAETRATAERQMEVNRVTSVKGAEINKEVANVAAEQKKQVAVVEAEGALQAAKLAAEGIQATGIAQGEAEKARLMAAVAPQVELATKIGANEPYQNYLVRLRQVEAGQVVGVAQAEALSKADVKIIANGGDASSGLAGVGDLLTSRGGQAIGAMLEGLAQTEAGEAVIGRVTGKRTGNGSVAN